MKNLFAKLVLTTFLLSIIIGCKKESGSDMTETIVPPNAASFLNLREQALSGITQTVLFKAEDGLHFVSERGAVLDIGAGDLFDEQWNTVFGDVVLSFVEIYDRGNMVATNKALMGYDDGGNLLPLVTGGQFLIEVRQGDQVLKPGSHYNLSVPAEHTGGIDTDMLLWQGEINADGNLVWEEVSTDPVDGGEVDEEGNPIGGGILVAGINADQQDQTYDIFFGSFGWTNVDRFTYDSRPKTKIRVVVPIDYNNGNASLYLAYEDQPYLLAQLDEYYPGGNYFTEHYGFVPIGINLHVIFVSESAGKYVYTIKQVAVGENQLITISEGDLITGVEEELVSEINSLY